MAKHTHIFSLSLSLDYVQGQSDEPPAYGASPYGYPPPPEKDGDPEQQRSFSSLGPDQPMPTHYGEGQPPPFAPQGAEGGMVSAESGAYSQEEQEIETEDGEKKKVPSWVVRGPRRGAHLTKEDPCCSISVRNTVAMP